MPQRGRQSLANQHVFFVTTTVKDHKLVFNTIEKLNKLRFIISKAVQKYSANLYGYVLMSNHFHLLIELKGGGPELSSLMRDIKSMSWRMIFPKQKGIWEARFDDVAIYTEEQFCIKLGYIHDNPVKAKLVSKPEDYQFSSAVNWIFGVSDGFVTTKLE